MGYTTSFTGKLRIDTPLTEYEANWLNRFFESRHMKRDAPAKYGIEGEFCADGDPYKPNEIGVFDYNAPPRTQPSLWCDLEITEDRQHIQWNGSEKTYFLDRWVAYIIKSFLWPAGYTVDGTMIAQGEDAADRWKIIVSNNIVSVQKYTVDMENDSLVTLFDPANYVLPDKTSGILAIDNQPK